MEAVICLLYMALAEPVRIISGKATGRGLVELGS